MQNEATTPTGRLLPGPSIEDGMTMLDAAAALRRFAAPCATTTAGRYLARLGDLVEADARAIAGVSR